MLVAAFGAESFAISRPPVGMAGAGRASVGRGFGCPGRACQPPNRLRHQLQRARPVVAPPSAAGSIHSGSLKSRCPDAVDTATLVKSSGSSAGAGRAGWGAGGRQAAGRGRGRGPGGRGRGPGVRAGDRPGAGARQQGPRRRHADLRADRLDVVRRSGPCGRLGPHHAPLIHSGSRKSGHQGGPDTPTSGKPSGSRGGKRTEAEWIKGGRSGRTPGVGLLAQLEIDERLGGRAPRAPRAAVAGSPAGGRRCGRPPR